MSQSIKRALPRPGHHEEFETSRPDALPRAHWSWLRAILARRFGRDAAEDLVQETFLRAHRAEPGDLRHPRAWLLRIALNAGRDHQRRVAVRLPSAGGSPEHGFAGLQEDGDQEQALLLRQVVLSLPHHLREVFLLSRFGGLTYEEIARRCGISVKTVEWRMTKALALCAEKLRG